MGEVLPQQSLHALFDPNVHSVALAVVFCNVNRYTPPMPASAAIAAPLIRSNSSGGVEGGAGGVVYDTRGPGGSSPYPE
jgi:hypothetical protein